jgi:hypothetical protein
VAAAGILIIVTMITITIGIGMNTQGTVIATEIAIIGIPNEKTKELSMIIIIVMIDVRPNDLVTLIPLLLVGE